MITEEGINGSGETHWKLHVPEEHCVPGLEVGIYATERDLKIGGELINWGEIEKARKEAQRDIPF